MEVVWFELVGRCVRCKLYLFLCRNFLSFEYLSVLFQFSCLGVLRAAKPIYTKLSFNSERFQSKYIYLGNGWRLVAVVREIDIILSKN